MYFEAHLSRIGALTEVASKDPSRGTYHVKEIELTTHEQYSQSMALRLIGPMATQFDTCQFQPDQPVRVHLSCYISRYTDPKTNTTFSRNDLRCWKLELLDAVTRDVTFVCQK